MGVFYARSMEKCERGAQCAQRAVVFASRRCKKVLAIYEPRFIFTPFSLRVDGLPTQVTTELPGNEQQWAPSPWTTGEQAAVPGGGTSEFGASRTPLVRKLRSQSPRSQRRTGAAGAARRGRVSSSAPRATSSANATSPASKPPSGTTGAGRTATASAASSSSSASSPSPTRSARRSSATKARCRSASRRTT